MKKYFQLFILFLFVTVFIGCKKFLDVVPKGVVIPEKVEEFNLMLNSAPLTSSFPQQLLYASDDINTPYSKTDNNPDANAYFWSTQLNNSVEASPAVWGPLYRSIYNTNVIINKVMDARDGTEKKKKQILGEALTFRAAFYFDLATFYTKAYDKQTASTAPGIPLVTSTDVTEKTPPRASLQATFDTIVTNLKTAAEYLPVSNVSNARINKYAAYGLLSRVYLYMQDYTNAELYAGKALKGAHALVDYNDYVVPLSEDNTDILWHRLPNDIAAIFYVTYSNELIDLYGDDDLRKELLAVDYYGIGEYYWGGYDYGSFGISFPEIYLTQAEALARSGKIGEAMDIVNLIRVKRIANYAYEPVEATSKEEALKIVLNERRLELPLRGTRWMDMKRLDAQGKMPVVERVDVFTAEVLEKLAPKSTHYTFEIPSRVLMFNPNMEKNFK